MASPTFLIFSALTLRAVAQQVTPLAQPVQATFLINGLHCPPCTATVESSLKHVKGVQSASVNWNTKNARITFDENEQVRGTCRFQPYGPESSVEMIRRSLGL